MTEWKTDVEYRTRDGREARFIGSSPDGTPVFAMRVSGNSWSVGVRHRNGHVQTCGDCPGDILPPRRGVWLAADIATGRIDPQAGTAHTKPSEMDPWVNARGQFVWRFFIEAEPQP